MTKQRTMARQPASIHAKIRRAPPTKPAKVVHRPPVKLPQAKRGSS